MSGLFIYIIIIVFVLVSIAIVILLLLKRRNDLYRDRVYRVPIKRAPSLKSRTIDRTIKWTFEDISDYDIYPYSRQQPQEAELAAKREFKQKYEVSIAHPRLLSKGYASLFVVQIYPPSLRFQAKRVIKKALPKEKVKEHLHEMELEKGLKVRIKLSSSTISFSDPVIKQIENGLITAHFTAIPGDNCRPGSHAVVLSIIDTQTQVEYLSSSFNVSVVDFAFDHVSRRITPISCHSNVCCVGIRFFNNVCSHRTGTSG